MFRSLYLICGKYKLFKYDKLIHKEVVAMSCKPSLCYVRKCIPNINVITILPNIYFKY